jgi:hypothetical protein
MDVLFLDDSPERHRAFEASLPDGCIAAMVETYDQAVAALAGRRFDVVYLDRDLNDYDSRSVTGPFGLEELTGEHVAKFIAEMPADKRPLCVVVHSWNPDGARRMVATCRAAGIETYYRPFSDPKCQRCEKPIAVHTGDGRVDGVGYVCPGPVRMMSKYGQTRQP